MPTARVLIDGPSELVFDYAIPAGLPVQAGCRVRIPLRRKSSTGTGAKHYDPEHSVSPRAAASADLGAGVAVDFECERNLDDLWCLPGHGSFLIPSPAQRRRR
jgi:hypothetical protein